MSGDRAALANAEAEGWKRLAEAAVLSWSEPAAQAEPTEDDLLTVEEKFALAAEADADGRQAP